MHHYVRVAVLVAALLALRADQALGHAGPRSSDPEPGATLGASPELVRLSFSEDPDESLSVVRVHDTAGNAWHEGKAEPIRGDSRSVVVRVRPLERGIYIVSWRVVSAVDGHASEGSYSFGVRMTPAAAAFVAASSRESVTAAEMVARSGLMLGLMMLLGSSVGCVCRFSGPTRQPRADPVLKGRDDRHSLGLSAAGWLLAAGGLGLLGLVQHANSGAPLADFLQSPVGRGLTARGVTILAAGAALLLAATKPTRVRQAMVAIAIATLAAIAAHAAAGHAAADRGWRLAAMVTAQWAHFAAAGVWIGGLAALLLDVRGTPSVEKADRVRRFSSVAACSLLVVVATGLVRSVGELSAWRDLLADAYGRALSAKILIAAAIAVCGAVNRWRNVSAACRSLRGLRLTGSAEIALAGGALFAAAALGSLAPPRAGLLAVRELVSCGTDEGTTVRVCLTAASDQPGPNRFVVRAVDYDSRERVPADRVTLRFTSREDPGLPTTSLDLRAESGGTFEGSGANVAFPGRWRIDVAVQMPDDSSLVPLDIETASPPQSVSVFRAPGKPPEYTAYLPRIGQVVVTIAPVHSDRNRIDVAFHDMIGDAVPVESMVLTLAALESTGAAGQRRGDGQTRQVPLQRTGPGRFRAEARLDAGRNELTATARVAGGRRVRARLEVERSVGPW